MSSLTYPKLSLNVFINKLKTKVLFAEANSDFINVLLSFLTLPLGKIVTILQNHCGSEEAAAIGSLNNLYKGLSDLDTAYFSTPGAKEMLLNPRSSFRAEWRKLVVDIAGAEPLQYYRCEDGNCSRNAFDNISVYSDIATCDCGRSLNREVRVEECRDDDQAEAFVISPLLFIVTDDLLFAPTLDGAVRALRNFGITDIQGAEMKTLSLGPHEICQLLKMSLTSETPLTDMIMKDTMDNPKSDVWWFYNDNRHKMFKNAATESRKLVLGAFFHKSTNEFLFAEATDEFVELLFSFLAIPLGGVDFLLHNSGCIETIKNICTSAYDIDDQYFITPNTRDRLINPKLAHGYLCKNQFLPLSEEGPPKLYYDENSIGTLHECSFHEKEGVIVSSFKSSKEAYVKKQTMCFVRDDLTMSSSLATVTSILNDVQIPLSDVRETELHIGVDEAIDILEASLVSKTALTDGLSKLMQKSQPKKKQRTSKPKVQPCSKGSELLNWSR